MRQRGEIGGLEFLEAEVFDLLSQNAFFAERIPWFDTRDDLPRK